MSNQTIYPSFESTVIKSKFKKAPKILQSLAYRSVAQRIVARHFSTKIL